MTKPDRLDILLTWQHDLLAEAGALAFTLSRTPFWRWRRRRAIRGALAKVIENMHLARQIARQHIKESS